MRGKLGVSFGPRSKLTLTQKIGALLLLPAIAASVGLGCFLSYLYETRDDTHFVNVAGRQRLLASELGAWAQMVTSGQEEDRRGLRLRALEFGASLRGLADGGLILGARLPPAPVEVRSLLADVEARWQALAPSLIALAELPRVSPRFAEAQRAVEGGGSGLVAASHGLVEAYIERSRRMQESVLRVLVMVAGATVLVFALGLWLTRRFIIRPVEQVSEAARRISSGDFSSRLRINAGAELAALVSSFNEMSSKVQSLLSALELRRRHAERIVASVPAGLLVADEELRVRSVNRAVLSPELEPDGWAIGRTVMEVLGTPELEPHLRRALVSDEPISGLELTGRSPVTAAPCRLRIAIAATRLGGLEDDRDSRLLVVVEDLTETERLHAQVETLDRRFQEVVETALDSIILIGRDGGIRYFNGAAERTFGWRRDEMLGKPVTLLMPAGYRGAHESALERARHATGEGAVSRSIRTVEGLRKDGSIFPLELSVSAFHDGTSVAFAGVLRDISERKHAENALERSLESFRLLIERSPDAIVIHRKGLIVHANPAAVRYLGYDDPKELVGKPVLEIVHPDDRASVAARVKSMAETRLPAPAREERFVRRDGSSIDAEVVAIPITHEGETAFAALARDLTERRAMTTRMMQVDRLVSAGTLAAGVGHEINNPLTYVIVNLDHVAQELAELSGALRPARFDAPALLGSAGVVELRRRTEELREPLAEARMGVERVQRIVRDLRTFARAEEDRREAVDVARVLESVVSMAWNEIRHRARLVKDYSPAPPVMANEGRLGQIFLNLVINAAQAIPEGHSESNEIRISIRSDGPRVIVEVKDTGCGIEPDVLAHIFDPFFTTKPIGQGTGLGLSIVHSLVTSLGGTIVAESEPGRGSTFRVALPLGSAGVAEGPTEPPAPVAGPERRGRVLVVDDDPLVGKAMERILAREHEVIVAASGREALARIAQEAPFDAILCDLMMPEMTGMAFIERLGREHPELVARTVIMTGGAFTPDAREFLSQARVEWLSKPVSPSQVGALVRGLVAQRGA